MLRMDDIRATVKEKKQLNKQTQKQTNKQKKSPKYYFQNKNFKKTASTFLKKADQVLPVKATPDGLNVLPEDHSSFQR